MFASSASARITPFRFHVCLLAAGLLSACAGVFPNRPQALEGAHPDGTPRYRVGLDAAGRRHGAERWWHENGTLHLDATWKAGARDGVYRAWHPDGTPWYAGRDSMGVPVDTLRVWHPNGVLQTFSVFEGGVPVVLVQYNEEGLTPEQVRERKAARRRADSLAAVEQARRDALAAWVTRVRAAVETWWSLPESQRKTYRRAVARLRVHPDGRILTVTWVERSGSALFDRRAAQALAKARSLPPFPPELGTEPLDLRYEFVTPGHVAPRRRLQVRDVEGNGE